MTTRRRFTTDFQAKVALEFLGGDRTIQEIAARHKVYPNKLSGWKRQPMDGLGEVFSNGADRAGRGHEAEVPRSSDEPEGAQGDDPARPAGA